MTIAQEMFNDSVDWLHGLYGRWQDEKDHEPIEGYKALIQSECPQIEVVEMHKKPWGFTFRAEGKTYRFKATAKGASFWRTA